MSTPEEKIQALTKRDPRFEKIVKNLAQLSHGNLAFLLPQINSNFIKANFTEDLCDALRLIIIVLTYSDPNKTELSIMIPQFFAPINNCIQCAENTEAVNKIINFLNTSEELSFIKNNKSSSFFPNTWDKIQESAKVHKRILDLEKEHPSLKGQTR